MSATKRVVPENFTDKAYLACSARPCPICGKDNWCRSDGATWALCHRVESPDRWKDAGWFHRLGGPGNVPPAPATSRAAAAKPKAGEKKIWQTLDEANAEAEKLPPASGDPAALRMYECDYGLPEHIVPTWFKIFDYPKLGPGVVIPGINLAGETIAYKYKSLARNSKSKRESRYLCGGGGALALSSDRPDIPLVFVSGEEKALAAYLAGYSALCLLAGEKPLGAEWVAKLSQKPDRAFVLANDADEVGQKANSGTATALEQAGVSPDRIKVVTWPPDMPAGGDLNDILKTSGVEGLREFLAAAPAIPRPFEGEVFDVDSLFAIQVDPRENILGDHVLQAGELSVVAGQPDVGKTRMILQMCVDLLTGSPMWLQTLPIQRHDLRILVLQTENSAGRMQHDLANFLRGCSATDRLAVKKGLLFTLSGGVCSPDWNLERVSALCQHFRPDLAIFDPLGDFLFDLENENAAMEMRQAVKSLCRAVLAGNQKAAILAIHHAKSGRVNAAAAVGWDAGAFARGSKALASIARAQVNLAPGDESGETVLVSCGKCNNGRRFDPFAVRLNEGGIYVPVPDFDLGGWKEAVSGRGARKSSKGCPGDVVTIIPEGESLDQASAIRRIMAKVSVGRTRAYELLGQAVDLDLVEREGREITRKV